MWGAHLKAPVKPSATAWSQSKSQLKGMPDPVDHPDQWIKVEMDRIESHPHWWKEIRTLKIHPRECLQKLHHSDLSKPKALYFSWGQAVAFRLPLAQQEASGWWDSPPCFCGLCLQDFLSHADASKKRNFWTVRQEKTQALAWPLQCCEERLKVQTRVLCNVAQVLQKCMAPLMCLNRDEIVEASLLEPMGNKPRTSPNLVEEATLLGEELWTPDAPEATASLQECLEFPEPEEPIKQIGALSTPAPSSPNSKPQHEPPQKTKDPSKGLSPKACQPSTQISPATGSGPTLRRAGRYPTGDGNSSQFTARVLSPSTTPKSKTYLADRLWPSGCPLPN